MSAKRGSRVICEINITPLTDIFLVLLIIMMVVTPLLDFAGLSTGKVPDGDSSDSSGEPKAILFTVNKEGEFAIDGKENLMPGEVVPLLRTQSAEKPDGVFMEVNPDAPLAFMTKAMENCREAGISAIKVYKPGDAPKGK